MNSFRIQGSAAVIVIVILVAIVVGALGFVYWQNLDKETSVQTNIKENETTVVAESSDPYKGWKTYTSDRDGYSIKYPSNWFLTPESDSDGPYIRNFDPNNSSEEPRDNKYSAYPQGAKYLRVLVDRNENGKKNASNMSTTEWYGALGNVDIQDAEPTRHLASDVKLLKVNGLEAKSAKNVFTEANEVIYLLKGADLYSIWLYPYGSSSDNEMKMILDSFRYL